MIAVKVYRISSDRRAARILKFDLLDIPKYITARRIMSRYTKQGRKATRVESIVGKL